MEASAVAEDLVVVGDSASVAVAVSAAVVVASVVAALVALALALVVLALASVLFNLGYWELQNEMFLYEESAPATCAAGALLFRLAPAPSPSMVYSHSGNEGKERLLSLSVLCLSGLGKNELLFSLFKALPLLFLC